MINKKIYIFLLTLFFYTNLFNKELIKGDKDAPEGATFSFGIKNNIITPVNNFYVAAHETITTEGKNFALARLNRGTKAFDPLAPEKITLNSNPDQNNPLFGEKNIGLGLLRPSGTELLIAVTEEQPNIVYLLQNIFNLNNMILVSAGPVHDASGLPSSGIISLETNPLGYVFTAVKPAIGNFGDKNSGIAILARGNVDGAMSFTEVDARAGKVVQGSVPKAFPLDKTSPFVNIQSAELAAMQNAVAFHWDPVLQLLFIGLQTTSNTNPDDGTRAVVVGKLIKDDNGFELFSIAPDNAFDNGNTSNIIGIRDALQTISIYAITTMYTSTGLNYLIILGGNGTSQRTVFALPLVTSGQATGTLAAKNDVPINVFQDSDVQKLIARDFTQPAETQEEMTQSTDVAAQIGGGALLAGDITNIIVRDDTVYASVGNTLNNNEAGIYSSQALCDASGKIKGWTQWQRAAGTTDFVFIEALSTFEGKFIFATGNDINSVNTVFQTQWSDGNEQGLLPVTTYFNSIFNVANGGIQSLQTFLPSTPGLSDISLIAAGGIGSITLVQTGLVENGIIIPTLSQEFEPIVIYENGTIDNFPDAKIITINGGALNNVGPVTAIEIARNETNGWIFVGGSDGVAVLTRPNGSGWKIKKEELGNKFDGLTPDMSFKNIGNYRFVKKLIFEDNFLFVITNDTIDRINLITSDFITNTLDVVTVATKESLHIINSRGTILDALISQACAIIATTGGIVRIGDNKDIRSIESPHDAEWTPFIIHETAGAPTHLCPVSATNRAQDITRGPGGHLYVLTSNAGFNQSRINRFSISPLTDTEPMQHTTVQAFDDLFVKNIPSFFLNFGNFNSIFTTDGGLYFASRNKNNDLPPRVVITPAEPAPRVGVRRVGERSTTVAINFNNGTEINAFQRSQASGSWVIAGDFGMQVLE